MTVLDGIRAAVSPKTKVIYAKGCGIRDESTAGFTEAVAAARQADVAVVVLGGSSARDFDTLYEGTGAANPSLRASGGDMEAGEGFDRETLELLGQQLRLLQQIVAIGKPLVLVMIQGRPLNLNWAAEHVPAIVCAWYPGEQGGGAVADVLFGEFNPAGRLPISVPRSVGQLPVYYNAKPDSRRDYVEGPATPLYEFGFGLSYTHFDYSEVACTATETPGDILVRIDLRVTNSGTTAGDEVVQLYVRDEVSSVTTPVKSLKGFARIHLKRGESQPVQFELHAADMAVLNQQMKWAVEPGAFRVMVGASSLDIRQQSTFHIIKKFALADSRVAPQVNP
jgi:beta-glucosidase